ncbi:MAG: hypothetical protein BGO12_11455 [Verrucomicrobia bacterium 61-8]|nr:hypothetical protein [Verrucomicrobiota bacterium]OJV04654.1 MAG: hypothetical protein BGO12_11455 [Verrucomicrobia bacterium 61-8]
MIRKSVAILILLTVGALLIPVESRINADQRAAHLRKPTLDLELRERIGQMGFLAALSGFRSPLAAILWIEAHNAWERTEWGRMAGLFDTVTTLQPRSPLYWDLSSWHMAYNASVAAREDAKQPSEILRKRAERQYIQLGKEILERGIRNNPDNAYLQNQLGIILRDKANDDCAAADAFLKASELPGAPPYYARAAGYSMAKCPGREKEAYTLLKKLYDKGEDERKPSVIANIKELEKKLDVPPAERIP